MPFKTDPATGAVVVVEHNGKKLPVFVNAKGEEAPFDVDETVATISRLNGEARTHREAKEAAEARLGTFNGLDPEKAKGALEMLAKIDQKKLIDAGEVDRVKAEISAGLKGEIDKLTGERTALEQRIYDMTIDGAFASSKFIKDKAAIPADFVRARFGENFGIENDRIYAVDAAGNKIYSAVRHGELADFDEALETLVKAHPQRDYILRGTGANGSGAHASPGSVGGKRTVTRAAWEQLPPDEQAKVRTGEYVLVD